jgi:ATP-binding protein involved in chromosome partitioning
MVSRDDVAVAVGGVMDPALNRSLADLDMIRAIEVKRGHVRMRIALPTPRYPYASRIEKAARGAVSTLEGVGSLEIGFVAMTEDEQAHLRELLQGPGEPGASPLMSPTTRTRILAVASGKGGVGKSSVTVNLAVQLARMGKRCAVVDADVWGFSVPRMLGVDQPPLVIDKLMIPPQAYDVSVISMGFFVEEGEPVIWRGPMLHKALEQFLRDVYWGDPDYLVIDMPPGTGDISLSMAQFLPKAEVIVVTTPQPAAQSVAQRAALMAKKVHLSVFGVVENMSWFSGNDGARYEIFGSGGGEALAESLGVPLLGRVPLEPALREGGDEGRPISAVDPDADASRAFEEIARLIEEKGPRRRSHPQLTIRSG